MSSIILFLIAIMKLPKIFMNIMSELMTKPK